MTPAEVFGRIKAHKAAHRITSDEITKRDDTLAWMIGGYVARGMNNPRKYPKKPDMVRVNNNPDNALPMDDDGMQTLLTAYAEVHNAIERQK